VEACTKRLGENRPLRFGKRSEILNMARARAKEVHGTIYGEEENGGTATLYVSKVPFEKINATLKEKKSNLLMGKVQNALQEVNRWAKGFWIAPLISGIGALGLALYERKKSIKRSTDKKEDE
jgi:hypothetical protein